MLPLRLATQRHSWGVPASVSSKVQSLARANGVEDALTDEPFAELWVGTHPSGGAVIPISSLSLEAWLELHPEALGAVLARTRPVSLLTGRLPFLLKVLSINQALPLQAHPTTAAAGGMHEAHPDLYPDAAHKPEMVVSLGSGACLFAGFLSYERMTHEMQAYPQLREVLGATNVQAYLDAGQGQDQRRQTALAAMWDHLLLRCPSDVAAGVCSSVLSLMQEAVQAPQHPSGQTPAAADAQATGTTSSSAHGMEVKQAKTAAALSGPDNVGKACDLSIALSLLSSKPGGGSSSQRYAMLSAASQAWPDDALGVLGLMLLEDVVLSPGEAALIPAGMPHAYICGEVLEVQADSNNTVKGGLTDEPTDRQGLVDAATGGLLHSGQADTPALSTSGSTPMHEGAPCPVVPAALPKPAASEAGAGGLQLYEPDGVDEFSLLHCCLRDDSSVALVMDPGPGVLLVTGGSGRATVRAAAVSDALTLEDAELRPGTALFIAAGSSLSITSTNNAAALDAWITTANNRLFSSAVAAAPAGDAEASVTAAEQVATGIMMGKDQQPAAPTEAE